MLHSTICELRFDLGVVAQLERSRRCGDGGKRVEAAMIDKRRAIILGATNPDRCRKVTAPSHVGGRVRADHVRSSRDEPRIHRIEVDSHSLAIPKVSGRGGSRRQKLGVLTDVATNVIEAIAAPRSVRAHSCFMHCDSPEMDGYDATGLIRKSNRPKRTTQIVAFIASATQRDRER